MKLAKATLAIGAALGATLAAVPAAAQVNGIAISNPEVVILNSQARVNAYQQIGQTYASQIQQVSTARQELNTLQQSLDTNSDGQVTDAEVQAAPNVVAQIRQKEQQINQLYTPIALAQAYAIQQLVADYENAQNQVELAFQSKCGWLECSDCSDAPGCARISRRRASARQRGDSPRAQRHQEPSVPSR